MLVVVGDMARVGSALQNPVSRVAAGMCTCPGHRGMHELVLWLQRVVLRP